eukprot:1142438-Pelagomonas_calceolata.AAC.1
MDFYCHNGCKSRCFSCSACTRRHGGGVNCQVKLVWRGCPWGRPKALCSFPPANFKTSQCSSFLSTVTAPLCAMHLMPVRTIEAEV